MRETLSPFYAKSRNVSTYFIENKEDIENDVEMYENRIYFKGVESVVPGILTKTIKSLQLLQDTLTDYNYIIRSNISTVIDFARLTKFINQQQYVRYFGAKLYSLSWLDNPSGINDKKHWGTIFATGTLIGMSSKLCHQILSNIDKLRYEIVDDVAIGILYKEMCPHLRFYHKFPEHLYSEINNIQLNENIINQIDENLRPIAFRNKSINRDIDIGNMKKICNYLASLNETF